MTREEAIDIIKCLAWHTRPNEEDIEQAIKELEQEPILDKISSEIEALSNANPSYWHSGDMVDRDDVLEIIDKYKTETEIKE